MRVALAHDWLVGRRGGEAVLESIAHTLIQDGHQITRLYTMFDDAGPIGPTIDTLPKTVSSLNNPAGSDLSLRRWLLPLYPIAVAELSRALARDHRHDPVDALVSTSSVAVKSMRAPKNVPHLCYCHTPARYLWSQADQYTRGRAGPARALGLALCKPWLRAWDKRGARNVARFLANSSHTRDLIADCYARDAQVVHPPARTDYFTPDDHVVREGFWLFVGALEPYKRADLAISAARTANKQLLIVGDGSERPRIERLASQTDAHLLGRVPDKQLRDLYRRASCLLFPQVEDFGITAVEAQACGLAVAARRAGGALDSVIDRRSGRFFDEADPRALAECATQAEPLTGSPDCRRSAERFSEGRFRQRVRDEFHALLGL